MDVTGLENYSVSYTYDLNNRLLTQTQTAGAENEIYVYTYDAAGNQLTKSLLGAAEADETRVYNLSGQLMSVSSGGVTTGYAYWPSGLRMYKACGTEHSSFVWDGANLAYESGAGRAYLRGTGLIAAQDNVALAYYLFNGHGDVVQLTDSAGEITQEYEYDAFGVEKDADTADANPFRYCGEYFDADTGAYYLRARYYFPALGRFTSEDPAQDGLNWYTYCAGNPISFVDPSGCVIVLHGTDDEKNTILENLQMLTDHDLAYDTETGVVYIETLHSGDLQYTQGNELLIRLMNNEDYTTTIYITEFLTKENQIFPGEEVALGICTDSKILFNPYNYVEVMSIDPETGEIYEKSRPAYIGLAHELIHADRLMRGVALSENVKITRSVTWHSKFLFFTLPGKTFDDTAPLEEFYTVGIRKSLRAEDITENMIRAEHGLWLRGAYNNR